MSIQVEVDQMLSGEITEIVTYRSGTNEVEVSAAVGQTDFDETASDGEVHTQTKSLDFLIASNDLVISNKRIEPRRGDCIIRKSGEVYDMMPGNNSSNWSWSDGRKTFLRIHTVRRVKS